MATLAAMQKIDDQTLQINANRRLQTVSITSYLRLWLRQMAIR